MESETGWVPLLEAEEAASARTAIAAITSDLRQIDVSDASLYHGLAGIALLHGALARDGHGVEAIDDAHAALSAAADSLETERAPWLARGFGGIAFAIAQLSDLCDTDTETLESLDVAVANIVARPAWPFDWELPIGLLGLGVYGIERAHTNAGRAIIDATVAHLAARAERGRGTGVAWRASSAHCPPPLAPRGPVISLGLAYGVAGAVAFLGAARATGATGQVESLLADSVAWLCARDRPHAAGRFPAYVGEGWEEELVGSRGWCGGDLAVALALVQAGLGAAEPGWTERGIALARHAAPALAGGDDVSLCHGAVGHAHLLNRIAQATGASDLADLARAHYRRALAARVPGSGIGGFARISRGPRSSGPELAAGMQVGAAGVALGLLAAVSRVPPTWDRAMLMALPAARRGAR